MKRLARSSVTPTTLVCLMLFVLADGLTLFTDGRWVGELGWTPEWANAGLYLGGCLLAGIAAFASNAYFTPTFLAVVGANTLARRIRVVVWVWTRNVIFGVFGHIVVLAIALTITAVTAPSDGVHWESFVYALLPICIFVSLGTLLSALVPNIVGSALSIAIAYLLAFNVASGLLRAPILVGGDEGTLAGMLYPDATLVVWSVTALGMIVVLTAGAIWITSLRSASRAILVGVAALTVAFVAPSLLPVDLAYRLAPSDRPLVYHCAGRAPAVCVAAGHTRHLAELARQIDDVAGVLRSAGIDLSATAFREEPVTGARTDGPYLNLDPNSLNSDQPTSTDYAGVFSRPTECPVYSERDSALSRDLFTVGDAFTEWISERLNPSRDPSPATRLPRSWVRSAYVALSECSVPASVLDAIGSPR